MSEKELKNNVAICFKEHVKFQQENQTLKQALIESIKVNIEIKRIFPINWVIQNLLIDFFKLESVKKAEKLL